MAWALGPCPLILGLHVTRERLTGSSADVPTPQVQRGEDDDGYYAACGAKGSGEVGDDERCRSAVGQSRSGPFGSRWRHLRQTQGTRHKAQVPTRWRGTKLSGFQRPTLPMDGPSRDRELANGKVLDRGSGGLGYVSPPHPSLSPLALSPSLTRTYRRISYYINGC